MAAPMMSGSPDLIISMLPAYHCFTKVTIAFIGGMVRTPRPVT
jgi:hypothetical protein